MSKRLAGSGRRFAFLLVLMLPVTACAKHMAHGPAVCDGLSAPAATHGRELQDPATPDRVVVSGDRLLAALRAAC